MDAIEQAIRNAFSKGNPEDPAFREKVYRSASNALEKAIEANATMTPEFAERRRKGLLATITSIESEFVPAVEAVSPDAPVAAPAPSVDAVSPEVPSRAPEVTVSAPRRDEPSYADRTPELDRSDLAGEARPPLPRERDPADERKHRRRWGSVAGLVMLLVVVGLAAWIAMEVGLISDGGQSRDTAAAPSTQGAEGAPRKPGEQEALENWVVVFSPDDPTTVSASAGARAEVVENDGESAIRIASGPEGAPVRFDVGQGVLERIAGKQAVFDIVARTGDGPETQISVSCDFGALGDCGRNRYIVGSQRAEFLLQVEVPAGTPAGAGVIEIQSDVENGGKAVEIVQIRVNAP